MVSITRLEPEHWAEVERIYAAGIATGNATFEATPPTWEHFDQSKLPGHRWVAVDAAGHVLGWTAASAVSDRCVYAGVVEHSVYVDPTAQGQGVGLALLTHLASHADQQGIWTIQSGVFPENTASLALHQRAGFRVVGTRHAVGKMTYGPMADTWRDVVFIERRSAIAGTD